MQLHDDNQLFQWVCVVFLYFIFIIQKEIKYSAISKKINNRLHNAVTEMSLQTYSHRLLTLDRRFPTVYCHLGEVHTYCLRYLILIESNLNYKLTIRYFTYWISAAACDGMRILILTVASLSKN